MPGMLTSKITERSQTTLPSGVRQVLGLKAGQTLGYVIEGRAVKLVNASVTDTHVDPVLGQFLDLLTDEIRQGRGQAFPEELLSRARGLTQDVEIDHDARIEGDVVI